jgi:hypothetical protein
VEVEKKSGSVAAGESVEASRKPLADRNVEPYNANKPNKPNMPNVPTGNQTTARDTREYKEMRTSELDKELLHLNMEKEQLDQELARMPVNSGGKTVAQRRRKKVVEGRLDELLKEIGKVKRELRNIKREVIV